MFCFEETDIHDVARDIYLNLPINSMIDDLLTIVSIEVNISN